MTWVKFSDDTPTHPKVVGLSDHALACWFRALCYSAQHLTDGRVPDAAAKILATKRTVWGELEQAGLAHRNGAGWTLHDYTDYQPTKASVEAERAAWRDRQKRARTGAANA